MLPSQPKLRVRYEGKCGNISTESRGDNFLQQFADTVEETDQAVRLRLGVVGFVQFVDDDYLGMGP